MQKFLSPSPLAPLSQERKILPSQYKIDIKSQELGVAARSAATPNFLLGRE